LPRYAEINEDIFDDLVTEGLSYKAIYVYLYYSISSKNLIGFYRTRPTRDRVSANMDRVSWEKSKKELEEKGKILFAEGWVWIVGKAKKVKGKKQTASARKCLSEIPDTLALKKNFLSKYDTLSPKSDRVSANALPIPIPKKREITSSCYRWDLPHQRVAEKLKESMLQNNPKAKIPEKLDEWANTVRLMVKIDKRTLDEIIEVMDWSQKDSFWKTNILSMGKLRKQFDQLTMKMKRSKNGAHKKTDPSSPDKFTKTGYSEIPEPKT